VLSKSASTPDSIRFGKDFELDLRAYELRCAGIPLKLKPIPMKLLLFLIERRGQLVTRDQIVEHVWGKGVFLDTDNSINGAISKIRQVLRDDAEQPHYVQTVTGRGYRFVASVIEVGATPDTETGGPSQPVAAENLVGKKVSHYRVLQVLGGGGMGVVYKAEDLKLGRQVALKFLPNELASDQRSFARFEREARAASALDHPNICSIYQLGDHEGQPFIVMQLLEGQTLREWVQTAANQGTDARMSGMLDFAIQITDGLAAAHDKGIIHRDIKPANIFITNRGQAKILDFGVAKFLEAQDIPPEVLSSEAAPSANATLTLTGSSMGTPFYLSPEQVRGEKLDARTDLFSLGLVLHEMATGHRAFSGNTASVIRDAVATLPALPVRQLDPDLPPELEEIVNKALEKDPARRYQSATELRADLERLRARWARSGTRPRRVWSWFVAGAAVIVAVLFGMNAGGLRERVFHRAAQGSATGVAPRPSIAVLGFKNLSGKTEEAWISTALEEMLGSELAAGQQLRVVPSENIARMRLELSLPTAESYSQDTLRKVHSNLSTDMVVLGSYLALGQGSGGRVRIDLQLQDTHAGDTIAVVSQDGTEADLADLVSRAGASLRQKLGIGDVSASDVHQIRAAIPANPEAARLYAEGLAKLQTFDALAARDLLQESIAADPNHALSHSALAECWSTLGYDVKALEEAKKAFDLSGQVSREDRLSIEARYRQLAHDYPAAIEIYRTLYNFFPDSLDYGLRLATAQSATGQAADALATVSRLHNLPHPQSGDARIDVAEAKANEQLSDYKHEQQSAALAAVKGQAQGARVIVASARLEEGWAWDHMGETAKSLAILTEAGKLSKGVNPHTAASAELLIGHVLYDKGQFEDARKSYDRALQEFREIGDQTGTARSLEGIGNVLYEQQKLEDAKKYYEEELRINQEIGRKQGVASSLGGLGNLLEQMGDFAAAARADEQASNTFRELGSKRGESSAQSNWGIVLFEQGDLKAAKEKIDAALAVQQQIGYKRGIGFSLSTLAEILRLQDHLDEAYKTGQQAIALRKEIGDESNGARSQTQLARIVLAQGKAAEAESLSKLAAKESNRLKMDDYEAQSYATLAEALLAQGKTKDAQPVADRAVELVQKVDRSARFEVILSAADASMAAGKLAETKKSLEAMYAEAHRYHYGVYELESQLRMGELDVQSGKVSAGRERLQQVQNDALQKGIVLIARAATSALTRLSHR
jgi:serine/threonine protein kinase/TolB-like protein/ATP/maltotriose-dependent transcriptional regulator MalT